MTEDYKQGYEDGWREAMESLSALYEDDTLPAGYDFGPTMKPWLDSKSIKVGTIITEKGGHYFHDPHKSIAGLHYEWIADASSSRGGVWNDIK